jgi:hypothetical protein
MQTERISRSHDEEKELLDEEEEEEEDYGNMIVGRHKVYFHFSTKASLTISFVLLSLLFNLYSLYHGYSHSHRACVADGQQKPGPVTRPSYC